MESPHIFLVGMMGSGKSTLGRLLATKLKVPFLDLDAEIEKRTNLTISEIFVKRGEFEFRTCEAQMLRELPSRYPQAVIATGGGAPAYFSGMRFMNAAGLPIYLDVDAETLLERLSAERADRPLLAEPHWEDTIEMLLAQRASIYRAAKGIISTAGTSAEESLSLLIQEMTRFIK